MKLVFIMLFTLATGLVFGQKSQTVTLNWKISPTERLEYATIMTDIDTTETRMDFGGFAKLFSDSASAKDNRMQDAFKKLNQSFKNIDLISTLTTTSKGVINVVITSNPKDKAAASTKKESPDINNMLTGTMIRGAVFATGGVQSFWVKSSQKNMIAVLFELPKHPVKVGDTWPLDVNLISNDQNFVCDSSYKLNEVKLIAIERVKGETIATLKYAITEYVTGSFNGPFAFANNAGQATTMKIVYNGIADFSIDKGRWVSYDGIMSLDATGVMSARKKTKFALLNK